MLSRLQMAFCAVLLVCAGVWPALAETRPVDLMSLLDDGIIWSDAAASAPAPSAAAVVEDRCTAPVALPLPRTAPVLAVVIDDMGLDQKRSARAVALPAGVTLAYLPYSPYLQKQADEARAAGHELIVHLPMEPDREGIDPGPDYLGTGMTAEELLKRTRKNLDSFTGHIGMNNHMGSKFTRDRPGMDVVMREMKLRGLIFLDSKTAPDSAGEAAALAAGVTATHRDVFIDHDESPAGVAAALKRAEYVALRTGSAVAIGHPKDATLDGLEAWLPRLAEKGIRLVPLSEITRLRHAPARSSAITHAAAE